MQAAPQKDRGAGASCCGKKLLNKAKKEGDYDGKLAETSVKTKMTACPRVTQSTVSTKNTQLRRGCHIVKMVPEVMKGKEISFVVVTRKRVTRCIEGKLIGKSIR